MNDWVQISEQTGNIITTSLKVAEVFEKEHKDVMRAIRNLECSKEFYERNFAPVKYQDIKGEYRPMFELTRDGFTFLAMGFTGSKAARFKEDYIQAFNMMEEELKKKSLLDSYMIEDPIERAQRWIEEEKKRQLLIVEIKEMQPKAKQFDRFISGENHQTMNVVAKSLGIGRNKLFQILREKKILMQNNTPYQQYMNIGYFAVKEKPIQMREQVINKPQTYVTAKGIDWLAKTLDL